MGAITSSCQQSQQNNCSNFEKLGDQLKKPYQKYKNKKIKVSKHRMKLINDEIEDFQKLCLDIEKVHESFKEEKWLKILGFNIQIGVYCRQKDNLPLKINISKAGTELPPSQSHLYSGISIETCQKFKDVQQSGIILGNKMSVKSSKSNYIKADYHQMNMPDSFLQNNEKQLKHEQNLYQSKSMNDISQFQQQTILDLTMDEILYQQWRDPRKIILVMSIMDISCFFNKELKTEILKKLHKDEEEIVHRLSGRQRGESYYILRNELKKSAQNCVLKQLRVEDFYNFFLCFKELTPIMKNIAQKYQERESYIGIKNEDHVQKILKSTQLIEIDQDLKDMIEEASDGIDKAFKQDDQQNEYDNQNQVLYNYDLYDPDKKDNSCNINTGQISQNKTVEKQSKNNQEDEFDKFCSICIANQNEIVLQTCGHAFCHSCIQDWNKKQKQEQTCPMCNEKMQFNENELFQLVDIDGKEDYSKELEIICENNISQAVGFILELKIINDIENFMDGLYEIDIKFYKNIDQNQLKENVKANKNAMQRVKKSIKK